MAINEESGHRLHNRLQTVLGPEDASTLMEYLPPVGWADVATRRDLDQQGALLGGELRAAVAELRGEMAELRGELRTGMGALGADLRVEVARSAAETRASLRTVFLGLVGLQMSGAGLALAVVRLG